jgi:hypothetical protein
MADLLTRRAVAQEPSPAAGYLLYRHIPQTRVNQFFQKTPLNRKIFVALAEMRAPPESEAGEPRAGPPVRMANAGFDR